MSTSDSKRDEIIDALARLLRILCPESLIELSFQAPGQCLTGYYADKEMAAATAVVYGMQGFESRLTLNPVGTACTALYRGRLQQPGPGLMARDLHIAHRNWLVFSLRPSTSPQDIVDEPDTMLGEATRTLISKLAADGWPEPVIARLPSSCDILYRINLATKDEGVVRNLLRGAQEVLARKGVCVDHALYQAWASRPLYGCPFGAELDGHRQNGHIVMLPNAITKVPRQLLENFAGWAAKLPQTNPGKP